jgi:hypothetical protein
MTLRVTHRSDGNTAGCAATWRASGAPTQEESAWHTRAGDGERSSRETTPTANIKKKDAAMVPAASRVTKSELQTASYQDAVDQAQAAHERKNVGTVYRIDF